MQSVHVQFDWKSYFWCLKYVLMLALLDFYSSNVLNEWLLFVKNSISTL